MDSHFSSLVILQVLTIIAVCIITIYVFSAHKKWIKFSQGFKPLALAMTILLTSIIMRGFELKIKSINDFIKILILDSSMGYSVGITRLILVGYIVLFYGLEIILIVSFKKFMGK